MLIDKNAPVMNTLSLSADSSSLVIETSDNGWAKCYLVAEERIYLGADDFSIITSRLSKALEQRGVPAAKVAGEIEGTPVAWILSLAEAHHVLYTGASGSGCLLFWQDARTSPVSIAGVMCLSSVMRQQWVETLGRVLEEAKQPFLALA